MAVIRELTYAINDFRTQLSAAPLKHFFFHLWLYYNWYFRTQLSAAPLKPTTCAAGSRASIHFRTQLSAAPLKRARG